MTVLRDVITAVLFPAGAVSCLLGAVGLLRFPDTGSRLHAAAKAQTLGLLLILLGATVQAPLRDAWVLVLVILFQLLTAPVTSQIIGRTVYRVQGLQRHLLIADELTDRLVREGTPPQRPDDAPGEDASGEDDADR